MRNLTLVLALCAALAGAGCGVDTFRSEGGAKVSTNTLRLPILAATALETLDPIQSVELVQFNLDQQLFEGLVSVSPEGRIQPALASSWEHSADYRHWRLHLRNARFVDDPCFAGGKGRLVTAADVIKSWLRGLDPGAGSKNSWALSRSVVGAADFAAGKRHDVPGLRALDQRTVDVELVEGDREFLSALTVLSTYVVAPESVSRYGKDLGDHPVGTGPFRLAHWEKGQMLELARNSSYTGDVIPKLDTVRFIFFRSEAQIAAAFDRGDLDVRDIQGSDIARIRGDDPVNELQRLYTDSQVVNPGWILKVHLLAPAMGADTAFGGSREVRRALSQIFPRSRLQHDVLRGLGQSLGSILPPMLTKLHIAAPPLPDPTSILRQALQGRTVKIAYVSSRIDDATVSLLRQDLDNLGVRTVVFPSSSLNALFTSYGSTRPDLTLLYWSPFFPSLPEYLQALLRSAQPVPNFTLFADDRLDHAVAELRNPNGPSADQLLPDIERVLNEQMPWIPLYYDTPLVLARPRVHGYAVSPVSTVQLRAISISQP